MRPDADTAAYRDAYCLTDRALVTCVRTARDVGGRDEGHELGVGTRALTEIAVDIDRRAHCRTVARRLAELLPRRGTGLAIGAIVEAVGVAIRQRRRCDGRQIEVDE